MSLAMISPTKHPKTGVYWIRKTIPKQLRPVAEKLFGVKAEFLASLGTKDCAEAKRLAPVKIAEFEQKTEMLRAAYASPPASLTPMQAEAVAGEWYKASVLRNEAAPGSAAGWEAVKDDLTDPVRDEDGEWGDYVPDGKALSEAERILFDQGIIADRASVLTVAQALWRANSRAPSRG